MGYLTDKAVLKLGLKSVGQNVLISEKASIYNADKIEIGDNSRIDDFCVLSGQIKIGRNVHIAVMCHIAGGSAGVTMEDFSGLASGCTLLARSDDYSGKTLTNPTVPNKYQNINDKPVILGRHTILGTDTIVFPGVNIAEGNSVGAASVVMKSTEPWSIYVGIPARKIKSREQGLLELESEYLASEESNS